MSSVRITQAEADAIFDFFAIHAEEVADLEEQLDLLEAVGLGDSFRADQIRSRLDRIWEIERTPGREPCHDDPGGPAAGR